MRNITKKLKDPKKRAEHNKRQLDAMTERLKDPEKCTEHNNAVTERLKDPEKRAMNNNAVANSLKDPEVREKHNKHVLEKYRTNREEVSSVIQSYFAQISQGPTYVCSCCGCSISGKQLLFLREKLVSTNLSNSDFVKQVIILFYFKYFDNYLLLKYDLIRDN